MAARSNGGAAAGNVAEAKTSARAAVAAAAKLSRMARESVVIAVQPREGDMTAWWRHMYHRCALLLIWLGFYLLGLSLLGCEGAASTITFALSHHAAGSINVLDSAMKIR